MGKNNKDNIKSIFSDYELKILSEINGIDDKVKCEDKEGFLYYITPYNLRCRKNKNMSSGRYNNKNIYKNYNMYHFIKRCNSHTYIVDIPDKIDIHPVTFKCGVCNKNFFQLWKVFINSSNMMCPNCSLKRKNTRLIDIERIKEIFLKKGYTYIDDNISYGMHHSYYVKDIDGYKGRMMPYTALKNNSNIEKFTTKNKYSIDNINLYCGKHNINVLCLDKEFGTYKKLKFKCSCGNIFYATWDNVKNSKHRCNECSKVTSNNEQKVSEFLDYIKLSFVKQYNIGKFKGYNNLFYDFYIDKYRLFIEVDGEQHFKPVCFGGISYEDALNNFECQKQRDFAKDLYCKQNNYHLLRIGFFDIKNGKYKEIISAKIDELSK